MVLSSLQGPRRINFWQGLDNVCTAIIYWVLLSANLFTHSLHQVKMDLDVARVSSLLVLPDTILRKLGWVETIALLIDTAARTLLAVFLMGLTVENFGGEEYSLWSQALAFSLLIDFLSQHFDDGPRISILCLASVLWSWLLSSFYPVAFCVAWLVPKHNLSGGLKLPLSKDATEEPLDINYELLGQMVQSDHGNNNLYFVALKELYYRVLHSDLDKAIATDKFFAGSRSDQKFNALSYYDTARAQIARATI